MRLPLAPASVLLLATLGSALAAEVRLPAILSDGAVLQREAEVVLWGWATPGERVAVRADWMEQAIETVADDAGRWRVAIRSIGAGGPHEIEVAGTNTLRIRDVLLGEVWIASGQSNMEWPLAASDLGGADMAAFQAAIEAAGLVERIREFELQNAVAVAPLEDCAGRWKKGTAQDLPGFSAAAFHFAEELERELDVPIGIVATNWGGTPAEAWASEQTLQGFPEFAPALKRMQEARKDPAGLVAAARAAVAAWWERFDALDPGITSGWGQADFDDASWPEVELPGVWSGPDLEDFDGSVWYRRAVELPAEWAGRELAIELGPIDDHDQTYFSGAEIGAAREEGSWATPRHYVTPAGLAHAGRNVIAVRAVDTGGIGGLSGTPDALRLYPRDAPEAAFSLAGAWRTQRGASCAELGRVPSGSWLDSQHPAALYDAMIAPLLPCKIRGAIWYQGESNRERAQQYRALFPALIADWRARFGQGPVPFYYVQISPFGYGGDRGEAAELREAQLAARVVPSTGMACTMDLGDPSDIHPRNKRDVGARLARLALARTFGRPIDELGGEVEGPIYRSMRIEGDRVRLAFEHAASGLEARGGTLACFTIAGADRVFHRGEATIERDTVVVRSPAVPRPEAVRFAWGAADASNLFNAAGLPASSFRTDSWPAVSARR
jgi:sialate O-acetylesterase